MGEVEDATKNGRVHHFSIYNWRPTTDFENLQFKTEIQPEET